MKDSYAPIFVSKSIVELLKSKMKHKTAEQLRSRILF